MMRMIVVSFALMLFYSPALFACPSGQSCPAGKDCVADSSLCVADSGSSSEPTTTKDQLGLTLEPRQMDTVTVDLLGEPWVDPLLRSSGLRDVRGTSPDESSYSASFLYNLNSISQDALNASTPPFENGIWGLGEGVMAH